MGRQRHLTPFRPPWTELKGFVSAVTLPAAPDGWKIRLRRGVKWTMPRLLLAAAVALLAFVPLALARATNTVAITGGPSGTVNTKDASFTFSSTGAITNFKCSLDGGAANDCTSPTSYTGLGDGGHTFALQGFRSSTGPLASQTRSWSIDATPPDTTITSQIPAWIKSTDLAIAFSSGEQASFRCRLDGGAWTDCGSPFNLTGLAQGSHSFDVVAADAAGNVDPSPASASWRVDTVAPETTITPVPEFTKLSSLHVAFDANEPQVTFQCRLDVGAYSSCSSPKTLSALAQGTHTLQVYAADQAGNSDASPATETWIVDTTPPVAALVLPVGAFQFEKQFTVSWKGGDAHSGIARYDVRVRSAQALGSFPKTPNQAFIYASWKAGTTIVGSAFSGQPGYTYCFDVRAKDKAGNVGVFSSDRCTALPFDDVHITSASSFWEHKSGAGYYLGTYTRPKSPLPPPCFASGCGGVDASLKPWSIAYLLVGRCPTCGSIRLYTDPDSGPSVPYGPVIKLSKPGSAVTKQTIFVAKTKTKPLELVVRLLSGQPRIDGLMISRASVPGGLVAAVPIP